MSSWWRKQKHPTTRLGEHELVKDRAIAKISTRRLETRSEEIDCWSFVSSGFEDVGQRNIAITLKRRANESVESPPEAPLTLLTQLYALACDGRTVGEYEYTVFANSNFLGFGGLAYGPLYSDGKMDTPSDALHAVMLTSAEAGFVSKFSPTRILARLGHSHEYYPFPSWNDRDRVPVFDKQEASILCNVPVAQCGRATAHLDQGIVTLSLSIEHQGMLVSGMSSLPQKIAALTTGFCARANAHLVWWPGDGEPSAITPIEGAPSSTSFENLVTAGSFVVLLADDSDTTQSTIAEDGFVVRLTNTGWSDLIGAISDRRDFFAPPGDNRNWGFRLRWRDES